MVFYFIMFYDLYKIYHIVANALGLFLLIFKIEAFAMRSEYTIKISKCSPNYVKIDPFLVRLVCAISKNC